MKEKHYIKKVLNNNVVFQKNKDGKELNKELNDNLYVTLCDHIYYAVERYHKGLIFQNQLVWKIRQSASACD